MDFETGWAVNKEYTVSVILRLICSDDEAGRCGGKRRVVRGIENEQLSFIILEKGIDTLLFAGKASQLG